MSRRRSGSRGRGRALSERRSCAPGCRGTCSRSRSRLRGARQRGWRQGHPDARSRDRTGSPAVALPRCTPYATEPTDASLIYVLFWLMVTAVWGWTFVLVKDALTQYPTLPFLQLRFILAFLVMFALVRLLPSRREAWVGVIAGAVLAAGYLTQTVGLTIPSPGNSGLITGLFVVFMPLIDRIFGVRLRWFTLAAVAIALTGTVLLVGGPSGFGLGDLLTVACAFFYALHLVLLSRWSPRLRPGPLGTLHVSAGAGA